MQRGEKENEREKSGMNDLIDMIIPKELVHSFFFSENEIIVIPTHALQKINTTEPFVYEAAFFSGIEAIKPWECPEESIPLLLEEWQTIKKELDMLFAKREVDDAKPLMKKGVGLFIQFIYWVNGRPAILANRLDLNSLSIKPVNLSDRLEFILTRPALYHSFIQLTELMTEMNKHYVKAYIIKKASKHEA